MMSPAQNPSSSFSSAVKSYSALTCTVDALCGTGRRQHVKKSFSSDDDDKNISAKKNFVPLNLPLGVSSRKTTDVKQHGIMGVVVLILKQPPPGQQGEYVGGRLT